MSWHEECNNFDSRIEASSKYNSFNDTEFLLIQDDAEDPAGDKVYANKAVLSLISPVFYAQFYGPFSSNQSPPSSNQPPPIEDGTARGFKQLIKFICNPISFKLPEDGVVQVFEISYFAHKYQIGSLVAQCRQLLGRCHEEREERRWRGNELDILNWAFSSEQGANVKKTLTQEYQLLVNRMWPEVEWNFRKIFPNGEANDEQALLDEDLMLKILGRKDLYAEEHMIFMVALNYYKKLIEKGQQVLEDNGKRMKRDIETEWNEKLEKLKSVMVFEKVNPSMFAELLEKLVKIVPGDIISNISQIISRSWKDKYDFDIYEGLRCVRPDAQEDITFNLDCNDADLIHDGQLTNGVQIMFKINQDAILRVYPSEMYERVNCCLEDTIKLQNEGHYRDENSFKRTEYNINPFYVEANKKVTISYTRNCKSPICLLHLQRLEKFSYSKEGFSMEILELNGQPVTSPCYTFFNSFEFTRL